MPKPTLKKKKLTAFLCNIEHKLKSKHLILGFDYTIYPNLSCTWNSIERVFSISRPIIVVK